MTPVELELARWAVAAPGWDWRVGMKAVADDDGPAHSMRVTGRTSRGRVIHSRRPRVPDVTDEATLGAMLGLVWSRHPEVVVWLGYAEPAGRPWWTVWASGAERVELGSGSTRARAIVAALAAMEVTG